MVHGDMDPSKHSEMRSYLNGPIVGMRADFHGFGIIFDTYDNDNLRDNPSVFVVKNFPSQAGGKVSDFVVRFSIHSTFV